MSEAIPTVETLATTAVAKIEIRTLSDAEASLVSGGTAVISSADLGGGGEHPDGGARGISADRIYRK